MPKNQFKTRLQIAKNKLLKRNIKENNENSPSIGTAFKLSTELVSAVAVGTIIGFILDKTFGTKPWLIILFFFDPKLKIINIASELITINKLELVNEISNAPILISGPILKKSYCVIGFVAI